MPPAVRSILFPSASSYLLVAGSRERLIRKKGGLKGVFMVGLCAMSELRGVLGST